MGLLSDSKENTCLMLAERPFYFDNVLQNVKESEFLQEI